MFFPHTFEKKIVLTKAQRVPKIIVPINVLAVIRKFVDICDDEIGWLSTVVKTTDKAGDITCVIDSAYLMKQEVHSATTEIKPDGIAEFCDMILKTEGDQAVDKINRLRCWGHSHVNMDTSPSGQDDKQMREFEENGCDYFIRVIANKKGKFRVDYFDYQNKITFLDIPWESNYKLPKEEEDKIEEDYKTLVKKIGLQRTNTVGWPGNVASNIHHGGKHSFYNESWFQDDYEHYMNNSTAKNALTPVARQTAAGAMVSVLDGIKQTGGDPVSRVGITSDVYFALRENSKLEIVYEPNT